MEAISYVDRKAQGLTIVGRGKRTAEAKGEPHGTVACEWRGGEGRAWLPQTARADT